jgi:hypothetical protein
MRGLRCFGCHLGLRPNEPEDPFLDALFISTALELQIKDQQSVQIAASQGGQHRKTRWTLDS